MPLPALFPALASLALSGSGGQAAPSGAQSDNVFESSGWTVATGGSSASATALNPWLVGAGIAAATLVILAWMRRK